MTINDSTDIGVFAMRARPYGPQHQYNIKQALDHAQYVFVLIGSAGEPINFRNAFKAEEVMQMVRGSLTPMENDRVYLFAVPDFESNIQWVTEVQRLVKQEAARLSLTDPKISLVGHAKDDSSYYLKLFPQWGSINTAGWRDGYSSTGIREALYKSDNPQALLLDMKLPSGTEVFLRQWLHTPAFTTMRAEYNFSKAEEAKFGPHPYNDWHWHEAGDACCFQSGGVLLVQRGEMPGKGLWALPGGHRQLERFQDTALRELIEETRILELNPELTKEDLQHAIRGEKLFDNPWRSTRMVTTTVAYGLVLPGTKRPAVEGADDAGAARWWNLDEITRDMMFEDHYLIIQYFANKFNIA